MAQTAGQLITELLATLGDFTEDESNKIDRADPAAQRGQLGTVVKAMAALLIEVVDELQDGGYVS